MGARADASSRRRLAWWLAALGFVAFLVYLVATAKTGPVDPTAVRKPQTDAAVVTNSALIIFREGSRRSSSSRR